MAPQREIDEETATGALAQFLVDLTRNTPVRDLATKFGKSSSSWGNYLKGSHLIPKPLLGRLVEAFTRPGQARNDTAVRAAALWNAADAERRAGRTPDTGGHLVRQHQKLDDALQQLIKYQALALKTDRQLDELRSLLVYTKGRLENAQLQIQLSGERERARVERRLSEAKEHLGRVRVQQERARTRRMTVEEQQEFWMAEVLAAQQEISRLERESQDLVVLPPGTLEETRPGLAEAMDEADFEARLEHLTAEGLQDEALIEEDRRLTSDAADDDVLQAPHVIQGAVQPVSNTGLDRPPTSENIHNNTAPVAIAVHASDATPTVPASRSATQPDPQAKPSHAVHRFFVWYFSDRSDLSLRRYVLPVPLAAVNWFFYWALQGAVERAGKGAIIMSVLMCLPILYGSLRATSVPKRQARVAAVLFQVTWSVLLLFDLLPWPPPQPSPE